MINSTDNEISVAEQCKLLSISRSSYYYKPKGPRAEGLELMKIIDEIYTQHLRFGKKIKEVSELKRKILIKFDDNTNDLVDLVIGADGIFSNTRSFFEKKKNEPKFKKAIAVRTILKSKSELKIDEKKINKMRA